MQSAVENVQAQSAAAKLEYEQEIARLRAEILAHPAPDVQCKRTTSVGMRHSFASLGPDCVGKMASAYFYGKKTPKDLNKALQLAIQSSNGSSAFGQLIMGQFCEGGLAGVPQDDAEAFDWFKLAADQNQPEALNILGSYYFNGDVVQQDFVKAFECYERSANLRCSEALVNLGRMYQYGFPDRFPDADPFDTTNKKKGLEKALEYFNMAADLDDPSGCLNAAIFYLEGKTDNSPQLFKAWPLFLKGVELGDILCMINVAKIYDTGINQVMSDGSSKEIIPRNYRYYFEPDLIS